MTLGFAALAVAVGAGLAVWLVGGSSSHTTQPTDDPVVFLRGVVRQIAANDYNGVWQKLDPVQQRTATRNAYVQCEELSPIPGHLDSVKLVGVKDEQIAVPGHKGRLTSKAATFKVTISEPVLKQKVSVPMTVHAVAVEGKWRWILSAERYSLYSANRCPSIVAPPTGA